MATISSHVLDSITGHSAQGVRVTCCRYSTDSVNQTVFEVTANDGGRIAAEINIQSDQPCTRYELFFYSGDFFRKHNPASLENVRLLKRWLSGWRSKMQVYATIYRFSSHLTAIQSVV